MRFAKVIAVAMLGIAAWALPTLAQQDWPTRPIRIMIGFGAGGGTDVATRIVAEPLAQILGQGIVVENKPGAGGTLAGDIVAKGAKDGYNALMISTGHTVAAVMIKAQLYDAVKDFEPVGIIANSAMAIVVKGDFPASNVQELIDAIKKQPGRYNYATVAGSTQHLAAELFRQRAGFQAQAVPFRTTGEVITALIRKDVAFAIENAHTMRGQVASGDLKLLAVLTSTRFPALANVPTLSESGMPGFEVNGWYGLVYPAGVPAVIVTKTHAALAQVLSRPEVRQKLDGIGALAALSTPQELGKLIADEVVRWRDVAKAANLQPQ